MHERLCSELRERAREIGADRFFWEKMTESILSGSIKSIDLRFHSRLEKSNSEIAETIHKFLGNRDAFNALSKEVKETYFGIITIVRKGLGL